MASMGGAYVPGLSVSLYTRVRRGNARFSPGMPSPHVPGTGFSLLRLRPALSLGVMPVPAPARYQSCQSSPASFQIFVPGPVAGLVITCPGRGHPGFG